MVILYFCNVFDGGLVCLFCGKEFVKDDFVFKKKIKCVSGGLVGVCC